MKAILKKLLILPLILASSCQTPKEPIKLEIEFKGNDACMPKDDLRYLLKICAGKEYEESFWD